MVRKYVLLYGQVPLYICVYPWCLTYVVSFVSFMMPWTVRGCVDVDVYISSNRFQGAFFTLDHFLIVDHLYVAVRITERGRFEICGNRPISFCDSHSNMEVMWSTIKKTPWFRLAMMWMLACVSVSKSRWLPVCEVDVYKAKLVS